jgi:hypothetical protein
VALASIDDIIKLVRGERPEPSRVYLPTQLIVRRSSGASRDSRDGEGA